MYLREIVKQKVEQLTGRGRPSAREVREALRERAPKTQKFADDGLIPNSDLPVLLYRDVIDLSQFDDPAAALEALFQANGWGDFWRNGIYDYLHYHSRIHEVLGIARGRGRVRLGGDKGKAYDLAAGDVAVLPAGTGHQCLMASGDFLVVGAYPSTGTYDECRGAPEEHERALQTIPKVPLPAKDPVFGVKGPLKRLWGK